MADDKRELIQHEETSQPEVSTSTTPISGADDNAPPPEYTPAAATLQDGLNMQYPPGYRSSYPGHVQHHHQVAAGQHPYTAHPTYASGYLPSIVPRPGQGITIHGGGGGVIRGAPTQVVVIRQTTAQSAPNDYMLMAILVTMFCCLPFGIVGIVKAAEAKEQYAAGNYEAAKKASQSAGQWSKAGLITGIIATCICIVLVALLNVLSFY